MKPSKKQSISEIKSNKNEPNENSKAPKILNYFKSAPKTFVVEDSNNNNDNGCSSSDAIYVKALKKKLQNAHAVAQGNAKEDHLSEQEDDGARALLCVTADDCDKIHTIAATECTRAECVQTVRECQEWGKKYKELKKVYLKLTIHSTERDLKYEDLLKVATPATRNRPNPDEVILSTDGIFTPNEVKVLEHMALEKTKDSTFILDCLQYAYKSDLSVLCRKTLKGKPEWVEITKDGEKKCHAAKDPLTPEKVDRIKQMFIDRVSKCDVSSVLYGERIKDTHINKLFASGIKNIARKQK